MHMPLPFLLLVGLTLMLEFSLFKAQVQTVYIAVNCSSSVAPCFQDFGSTLEKFASTPGTRFLIFPGEYSLNRSIQFTVTNTISISRFNSSGEVSITCEHDAGLTFINSHDITISGLEFHQCGVIHNGTSKDYRSKETLKFLRFHAALYFLSCQGITLTGNQLYNSTGIAVQMYAVNGSNFITDNLFDANPCTNCTKRGGLYIEFPYCSPLDQTLCGYIPSISKASYVIGNNRFQGNVAETDNNGSIFILPNKEEHDAFGSGGGLSIFLKADSSYNTFTIENNTFTDNSATFGGGLFVEFQDNSNNNNVIVKGCNFTRNSATKAGGGARFSLFSVGSQQVVHNSITVINTVFSGNSASWGGGTSVVVSRESNTTYPTNSVTLSSCCWSNNTAQLGSGLDITQSYSIVQNVGNLLSVILLGCTFYSNSVKQNEHILGFGALYADSVPITFQGFVNFTENYDGSGLVAGDNMITFASNTQAVFIGNKGRDGAAIALMGFSYLVIEENTSLQFIGNEATNEGGAIFAFRAGGRNLLSSRDCFLRYYNPMVEPDAWETNITFDSNKANNVYNAIFTTSVYPCVLGQEFGRSEVELSKNVFCSNTTFIYKQSDCGKQVTTDPASFKFKNSSAVLTRTLSVTPGKRNMLGIVAKNDQGNSVTDFLVMSAHTKGNSRIHVDSKSKYISDDSVLLQEYPGNKTSNVLVLESEGPRVIKTELRVKFLECPPGFNKSTVISKADQYLSCVCPNSTGYYGFVLCNSERFESKLLKGYWIGNTSSGEVMVGQCKYCTYLKDGPGSHITVSGSVENVEKKLCGDTREGVLCGSCKNGHGPAINSYDYRCVKCDPEEGKYAWIIYILLRVALPFSLFLLLYLSSFSVTSGFLNGPIFFAQVITTVVLTDSSIPYNTVAHGSSDGIISVIYDAVYGIWNLDFCILCFPTPCLYPGLRGIDLLLVDYCIAFLPLLFVVLFKIIYWMDFFKVRCYSCLSGACSRRFPKLANFFSDERVTKRLLNGTVASIILSYNKIALMTAYLTSPTPLYGPADNGYVEVKWRYHVLYFDGNIGFFDDEHRKFAIPVLILSSIFLVILPLVLIVQRYDNPGMNGGFFNHLLKAFQKEFRPEIKDDDYCLQGTVSRDSTQTQGTEFNREFDTTIPCLCRPWSEDKIEVYFRRCCNPLHFSFRLKICHGLVRIFTSWGYEEYRWVAGFYLMLRLLFVLTFMFADDLMVQLSIQIILSILAAHVFLVFSPYKRQLHNIIDGTVFLLLVVIMSLVVYQYYKSLAGLRQSLLAVITQHVLILLPSLWIMGYIVYNINKQTGFILKLKKLFTCFRWSNSQVPAEIQPILS